MKASVSAKPRTVKAIHRTAHAVMRAGSRRLNPFIVSIAGSRHMPLLGIIRHQGRRSGRSYMTPLVARPTKDGFVLPLTFGEKADWFRNVQAAGGCIVRWKGMDYPLVEPEVVDWATARASFSPLLRVLVPVIGIEHFVQLRHAPASSNVSQM
jgi:deazaflavin-dependent oxidoreductase (nitroreductase family)